ncbi:hypothetical protein J0K78_07215 [Halobacillus sp. GSS1]|uniref:hypothetical protein n=1 Tax=Halobacillus sp. GSS1 TaxID=2815919 RepID=UPI001A8CC349|nr:hypothetical protein [Halobacillus sp. GSS1]MBN9654048.1 hypothetical protein [Halobacillus sp. GSS1]
MKIGRKKIAWKDVWIGVSFIVVLYFTLPHFGVNPYIIVITLMAMVEWVTKYILPWIVLYWAVRWIKHLESR